MPPESFISTMDKTMPRFASLCHHRTRSSLLASVLALLTPVAAAQNVDLIFVGDNIITMDDSDVQAVAVAGDRILATGDPSAILSQATATTRIIELGDRALLPGFIDAHGHFSSIARNAELLDLSPPPVGGIETIDDIVAALRYYIERRQVGEGTTVFGFGYDDSLLTEGRHPTRDDLDRASTRHPIIIRHVSGHLLVANSLALEQAGVSATTPDPEGGIIRRRENSREPNGVMEETAMGAFAGSGGGMTELQMRALRESAMSLYAGYGITTVQDANVSPAYVEQMRAHAALAPFPVDIVGYVLANALSDDELSRVEPDREYTNGYRMGGVKFTLDGSPQGRTAWLSRPYTEGPPGAGPDYVAYPSYNPEAYLARMPDLIRRGVPVLAHANGDAAIELMIDGVESAIAGGPVPDHRSVTIHAQLARPDQLDRMRRLGIIPSFYSVHPFFWGDWHRLSFGEARASFISPVRATIERGIPFTIHNDSPVVPPDMMRLVAITVNRETRSGYVLGPDQRATAAEALYAITQGAAYQYFEENEKGSITPGKRADLVILAVNPLHAAPSALADIAVMETFARGKSVYSRPASP